ncbi:small RNA 2'-O-methyltransferase-like isoform X2 [Limulus polyphemus]|uniref:Small RNA 2'-O-methyltransferase n=1 Tax=Limulus polyphemus TaxID=6850 RepID=A0ABM1S5H8_LIMPO|nr:small RNA 2'-O-methyltransferase-like isoform X2 [Limulus polyphemus]
MVFEVVSCIKCSEMAGLPLIRRSETETERHGMQFDPPVYIQRYRTVRDILEKEKIVKVIDFGCAEGKFLRYIKKIETLEEIAAVDSQYSCLMDTRQIAAPIAWDFLFKRKRPLCIKLYEGSISDCDIRVAGFDAVTCIELLEHLSDPELDRVPYTVFGYIQPRVAIFTTPNKDFNCLFPELKGFRHWDHKFEWDRIEFRTWSFVILFHCLLWSLSNLWKILTRF